MGVAHLRGFRLNSVTVPVTALERCCLNAVVVLLQTPNLAPVFLVISIFGISDEDTSAPSMPLSYSQGFCLIRSTCLYLSLVKLFKRHCSVSSSNQNAMENSNSVFEEDGDFDLAAEEEKGCGRYLKKEQFLFNLTEHVKCNVLQLDDKFYLQVKGIP
ncbi:hypothetical protein Peur_039540 [Populus x canadensis]